MMRETGLAPSAAKAQPAHDPTVACTAAERAEDLQSLSLFQLGGNQTFLSLLGRTAIQPKLRVGPPGDRFEQEADRAAVIVVGAMHGDGTTPALSPLTDGEAIQRKCARCDGGTTGHKCAACEKKERETIRRTPRTVAALESTEGDDSELLSSESAPIAGESEPGSSESAPLFQETQESNSGAAEVETAPAEADSAATAATGPALLVDDDAEEVGPDQMRKTDFLETLREAVCQTVDQALAGTGRDSTGCPHVEYWFGYLSGKSASFIERGIQRYATDARAAGSASEYIPAVVGRVRQSADTWARTGEVVGVPDDLAGIAGDSGGADGAAGEPGSRVQFKGRAGGGIAPDDPTAVRSELGNGQALDGALRSRMEGAFGVGFGNVRVHTDRTGARLSDRLNARAFTIGEHVAFGAGEYRPGTLVGDALIAHELAHVVQQTRAPESTAVAAADQHVSSALEADADRSAFGVVTRMLKGGFDVASSLFDGAVPRLRSGLALQRCSKGCSECKIKSGPTYSPSGTITPTAAGGLKTAHFTMAAEFEKANAPCCEVRQYIRWPTETPPSHGGFSPASSFTTNTWYEDRDANDKRYGHRSGTYSDPHSGDEYVNAAGTQDQAAGHIYHGSDDPSGFATRTGEWQFELRVLDTKKNTEIGTPASVTVDF